MNIYELHGRQAEQLQQLREYYDATQSLLREIKDGKVSLDRVQVHDTGWNLNPVEPEKAVEHADD